MRTSLVKKVLLFSLVVLLHNSRAHSDVEYEISEEDDNYQVVYVTEDELAERRPPRIRANPGKGKKRRGPEELEQTPANDRVFFPPYKFPFWGLPYGIYSNGGFVNPGLFPFVPGGPGFPPYDGVFGGPFGPGTFPGPGLNPFGPGVGTPMGLPQPAFPGGAPAPPGAAPPAAPAAGAAGAPGAPAAPKPKQKPKRKPKTTPAPYYPPAEEDCECTKHHPTPHYRHKPKPSYTTAAPCHLDHHHHHDYEQTTAAPYEAPSTTAAPEYTTAATTPAPYYPPSPTPAPYYPPPPSPMPQQHHYPSPSPIILMYTPVPYRRNYNAPPASPHLHKKPCPYKNVESSSPTTTTTTPAPTPKSSSSLFVFSPQYPQSSSSSILLSSLSASRNMASSSSSSDGYVLIEEAELEELQKEQEERKERPPAPKKHTRRKGLAKRKKQTEPETKKLLTFDTYLNDNQNVTLALTPTDNTLS